MAVAKFTEHVGKNFEKLCTGHVVVYAYLIFIIDILPVKPYGLLFIVQKTVVLIDDFPQGFEVAAGRIVELLDIDTRGKEEKGKKGKKVRRYPPYPVMPAMCIVRSLIHRYCAFILFF